MSVYVYKAVTRSGKVVSGRSEESSKQKVMEKLKLNELTPITVTEQKGMNLIRKLMPASRAKKNQVSASAVTKLAREKLLEDQQKKLQNKGLNRDIDIDLSFLQRAKKEDVIAFTQSLFLLKRANFTNTRAFATLLENTDNVVMKGVIEDTLNGVEAGEYIYSTLEYYTDIFPPIYVSIIKVGELSGNLTNALYQALEYLKESNETTRAVKKAVTGPLIQTIGLLLLTIVGVVVGVPVLENLYEDIGASDQIPAATHAFSRFVTLCGERWYLGVGFIVVLIVLFNVWKSTVNGRYAWDKFKLKVPIFGQLITRLSLQKFFKAMELNLANNAKLQDALEISKGVVNNYVLLSVIESAQENLQQGESWVEPFATLPNMPPMALEMLRIGMETDINDMVDKIEEFLKDDIDITIGRIMKVLPEVSTAIMGVVMIVFIIIVLRPVMDLYTGAYLFEAYGL